MAAGRWFPAFYLDGEWCKRYGCSMSGYVVTAHPQGRVRKSHVWAEAATPPPPVAVPGPAPEPAQTEQEE